MAVQVTTLPNGLRVASDTMAESESVALGIWAGVGTRNEPENANGIAHVVEHMLFKGTERRDAFRISAEMEDVGGYLNAYTTREETAYHCRVLPEDAGLGCDILSDMVKAATFPPDELAREREVIVQEIGQTFDTPDDYIFDILQASAYPGHNLGRPILGTAETVRDVSRETLMKYVKDHYVAGNMMLIAAGKIGHAALVALAEEHLGSLPRGKAPRLAPAAYRAGQVKETRKLEQLHLTMAFPGAGFHDPDYHAVKTLMAVLGGGMSSRLFQEVREKRGLAYTISAFNQAWADTGMVTVYAGTDPAREAELTDVLRDELGKAAKTGAGGITPEELARAKAQMRAGILMSQESSQTRCDQLAHQMLTYGQPVPLSERLAKIESVSVDDVRAAAARFTQAEKQTMVTLGPVGG
ncbi:MAG: insulinase family protein [Alphaproteobacteria bacterium]|nr:insulinase family protein [Alphaproteobacteria bacterium]